MMIVIETQYRENYGAADWDGTGQCPQYWKNKGGSTVKVLNVPEGADVDQITAMLGDRVVWANDYSTSHIIGVHQEDDSWLSPDETDQLEYKGTITDYAETVEYSDLMAPLTVTETAE